MRRRGYASRKQQGCSYLRGRAGAQSWRVWQQAIYDILDASARIVALISPDHLQSKVCKEEFNIALFRNRESDANILFPIYLKTTVLPTYMKMVNYADGREADAEKLRRACAKIWQQ